MDRVKEGLTKAGLLLEEYGGDVQLAMVSGKSGQGIEDLLQRLLLQVRGVSCPPSLATACSALALPWIALFLLPSNRTVRSG